MVLGNPDETGRIPLANRALLLPMTPAQTQASTVENGESPIGDSLQGSGPRVARRNSRAVLLWQCGSVACCFYLGTAGSLRSNQYNLLTIGCQH
jgi:hypothetical protein